MLQYYDNVLMNNIDTINAQTFKTGHEGFMKNKDELRKIRDELIQYATKHFFDHTVKPLRKLEYIILDTVEKYYWFMSYSVIFYIWRTYYGTYEEHDMCIGIDFEFNSKVIALMQLELYGSQVQEWDMDVVVLLYPPDFSKTDNTTFKFFTHYLLTMPKIMHGADSLDIPYLYYELLSSNPFKKSINREFNPDEINERLIHKFTRNLVDTRFLCEMANVEDTEQRRCSLYQLLQHTGVLSKHEYETLERNEHSIGELWRVNVYLSDLKKKKNILMYCLHDVVFLKELYHTIITKKLSLKSAKLVNDVTRLVYLMARKVSKPLSTFEQWNETLSQMNVYFVINDKKQKVTLQTLFDNIIQQYNKTHPQNKLMRLLQLGYFKSRVMLLLKLVIYYHISKAYTIYSKNDAPYNLKINIDIMYKLLLSSYPHLSAELLDLRSYLQHK